MSTGQDPRRRSRAAAAESAASQPAPQGDLPPQLLDQVMSETAAQLSEPAQLDPAVRAALVAVARQFAGQPLVLEPTGVALFEALLAAEFPLFAGRPALLAKAAREVAGALLADPTSHQRVEHLWLALAEEAS
jgi:hypothetical protein